MLDQPEPSLDKPSVIPPVTKKEKLTSFDTRSQKPPGQVPSAVVLNKDMIPLTDVSQLLSQSYKNGHH